jgi:hypothetical protein
MIKPHSTVVLAIKIFFNKDYIKRKSKVISCETFQISSSETWEVLREKNLTGLVATSLVSFSYPEALLHSLVGNEECSDYRDRLLRWGYQGETNCMFCRYGVGS